MPAAVQTVRALTGAEAVDIIVHCYGAITFMMAMLAGLDGVRSAVCSQVGAHNDPGLYRRHIIEKYGHIDCIFGRNAAQDVYPLMLAHLEKIRTGRARAG